MNRTPLTRFGGVRSSLYLLVFIVGSYSFGGEVKSAFAIQGPQNAAQKPQAASIEIPGTFKELPEADKVTTKQSSETFKPQRLKTPVANMSIDADKVTGAIRANSEPIPNGTKDEGLLDFHATAYCLSGRTASGEHTRPGVIAADPKLLPLGTVVHLRAGRYTGTYTVLDTGSRIKGHLIDVYVPTRKEAMEFGRRPVKLKVLGRLNRSTDSAKKSKVIVDLRP